MAFIALFIKCHFALKNFFIKAHIIYSFLDGIAKLGNAAFYSELKNKYSTFT